MSTARVSNTSPNRLGRSAKTNEAPRFSDVFTPPDGKISDFLRRHIGPDAGEIAKMLEFLGFSSLEQLTEAALPEAIKLRDSLRLPAPCGESEALEELRGLAGRNSAARSYIGAGYHGCVTPPVILRNILENPGWYTQYTPYQAEISQGRLEALLNFQTMIVDLTGLEVANASLLDEATAAAEAMALCAQISRDDARKKFFVSASCHPQTIEVVCTRGEPRGIEVVTGDHETYQPDDETLGALLQYPDTYGRVSDPAPFIQRVREQNIPVAIAADPLALTLLSPPGELGADIAVGSTQRLGMPPGFGGPHAAYFATRDEFKRQVPGRIVGVSRDKRGRTAYRLSLQTREQHIRRGKATSNICTAQVLPAIVASMYAVYHGRDGLRTIAGRIHRLTALLADALGRLGYRVANQHFFDTLQVRTGDKTDAILSAATRQGINFRRIDASSIGISLDETTADLSNILNVFQGESPSAFDWREQPEPELPRFPDGLERKSEFLTHPVFRSYQTETELLRYMHRLQSRDLSLTTSMIPLGSCTMKLNATAEMIPVTWPEFAGVHPFAPAAQTSGYLDLFADLESWLAEITGLPGVSLQPNAGSQGEFAGLLVIRAFHRDRGEEHRNVCLIPESAHGTNPASAVMAGFRVVPVACSESGDIDIDDLRRKTKEHGNALAAAMVTYPSTHGVFEEGIRDICRIVHEQGGQVYLDGANMNAQVGLCRPADFGADVCHLNLHKTFCIPHGGGGPGMAPICAAEHLRPHLPGHFSYPHPAEKASGAVAQTAWGSGCILPISWVYIRMMGGEGLTHATRAAILNANYIARRLDDYFPVLFKGANGLVAHECIIDLRECKKRAGVEAEDVAKRLMDYGFHAPTMSWPVAGTLMIEPTECESKEELDRFCDAMIGIHGEIEAIESGKADSNDNLLKNAPHTAEELIADRWDHPYSREQAAYPAPWTRECKFWPAVARIDNVYGDRNLVCTCAPVGDYEATESSDD